MSRTVACGPLAVLNEIAVYNGMRSALPRIHVWTSPFGLVEEYEYVPGRHAYRGRVHDVPIGAISILDSWEPHAVASDPHDRDRTSHYVMIYVDSDPCRRAVRVPADHIATHAVERIGFHDAALQAGVTPWHLSHVATK